MWVEKKAGGEEVMRKTLDLPGERKGKIKGTRLGQLPELLPYYVSGVSQVLCIRFLVTRKASPRRRKLRSEL